jgi:hypothetical protein
MPMQIKIGTGSLGRSCQSLSQNLRRAEMTKQIKIGVFGELSLVWKGTEVADASASSSA